MTNDALRAAPDDGVPGMGGRTGGPPVRELQDVSAAVLRAHGIRVTHRRCAVWAAMARLGSASVADLTRELQQATTPPGTWWTHGQVTVLVRSLVAGGAAQLAVTGAGEGDAATSAAADGPRYRAVAA